MKKMLKEIFYVFNRRQKVKLGFLLIIIVIGSFLELMGVTLILPFVNAIISPSSLMENQYIKIVCSMFGITDSLQLIILLSVVLIAVYMLKNIYLIFMTNCQYRFVYNSQRRLAGRMMKCYIRQPYVYHLSHSSAEIMRNMDGDVKNFFSAVISLLQLFTECCVCLVLVAYLFYRDKTITLGVCVILGLFLCVYMFYIRKKVTVMGSDTRDCLAAINVDILQAFGGIKEVKILDKEKFFTRNFDRDYAVYADRQTKYFIYGLVPRPMMETVCIVGMLIIIIVKLLNGTHPNYFIPTISIFAIAAFRMLPSFSRITNAINNIMYQRASVTALYQDLRAMEEIEYRVQDKGNAINTEMVFQKEIEVQHVDFKYPDSEHYVLKDVSLKIPKNKSVALIGPSGEGKTTLADIILGLLDVENGKILIDGEDIQENMSGWHRKLGYIPQSIYLVDDSIKKNIAYGIEERDIDEKKLWKALEDAQIKDFVLELEHGIDTMVGERGARLSGGQRQRIGIARALYGNPEVLILDEATSALDNDTEAAVMDAINHLSGNKTLIIIAHRLSTIKDCDIVYEVKNQKVYKRDESKQANNENDQN